MIAEGCSGGRNCCCKTLGYFWGVLDLCCPQTAGNSPGFICKSSEMNLFPTSKWPHVYSWLATEKGKGVYSELLGGMCRSLSHCLSLECNFSTRLMTKGGVRGLLFHLEILDMRKAMFSPRRQAICLYLQISLWLQLINYMLEMCQALSDQRSSQYKGQACRENLEESHAMCCPLWKSCCQTKCIVFWSFGGKYFRKPTDSVH